MSPFHRELTLAGRRSDLSAVCAFVEACCQDANIAPELLFDLELAVEEAATNVIEHAYKHKGGRLDIVFATAGRDVVITLSDRGRPFSPAAVKPPDLHQPLTERPIGGLGLHLMRKLMDEVQYSYADGVNTLVMMKRDALPAGSP